MNFHPANFAPRCRPVAQQIAPPTQSVLPSPAPLPQKPFLMPTPTTAPISLFGGNLTITPKPVAATPSPFSVAALTSTTPLIRSEPPPAASTSTTFESVAPTPQNIVPVAAPEVKKEVVSEPILSEESFAAASTAIIKLFADELTTSLRQSSDAPYTVHTCYFCRIPA